MGITVIVAFNKLSAANMDCLQTEVSDGYRVRRCFFCSKWVQFRQNILI